MGHGPKAGCGAQPVTPGASVLPNFGFQMKQNDKNECGFAFTASSELISNPVPPPKADCQPPGATRDDRADPV
jgi:hypothetical protein